MRIKRARLPDYSIGVTVLMIAIAVIVMLTRHPHLPQTTSGSSTPTRSFSPVQAVFPSPETTQLPSADPTTQAQPVPRSPSPSPRPSATARTAIARPTSAPTQSPAWIPDSPPVVKLAVTPTAGLSVTADASASYDNDQTPIARMVFNFGDETLVTTQWDSSASHTYADAGTYTVAVTVIDTAGLSATRTTTVTVG